MKEKYEEKRREEKRSRDQGTLRAVVAAKTVSQCCPS